MLVEQLSHPCGRGGFVLVERFLRPAVVADLCSFLTPWYSKRMDKQSGFVLVGQLSHPCGRVGFVLVSIFSDHTLGWI